MGLSRFLALLAPLLAGLGAAWALASTEGCPPLRRLARVGIVVGVVGALCLPFVRAAAVALSLAALVSAAYLLARALRAPVHAAQVAASLIPVALYAIVFLFDPVFEHAARTGAGDALGRRLTLGLELNPVAVTTISIFGDDFYHRPTFYRLDFAAYQHAPPRWTGTVAMYLSTAAALGALAAGLFALRKKKAA